MTKRTPVSAEQNIWFDAEQVDDTDLSLEQDYNSTITSSTINNHIGTGVLPEVLVQNVLFDSSLSTGFLDGIAVYTQNQPADNNLGNQLEIELINSKVAGKRNIKVAIIGLDFQSNLQYETFYFRSNEIQVTKKHFAKILVLLFNDFIGNPDFSFNLGGRLTIREANPLTLSRDSVMIAQDIEPNLFFRDFFVDGTLSLQALLQSALPLYNIDTLNIKTGELDNQVLLNGDVTTQIGQKFISTTNNIQKVTLLLSVQNLNPGSETDLVWNGDLIVSIYPLQSSIECPTDIAPNLEIDFSPSNIPIAQISVNYASLQAAGTVLDSVPQPVDFIFSNSPIAAGNVLTVGNYYAATIKRSGAANKCDILIAVGGDQINNSRLTTFTGTLWVDLPDQDLWFKIWTDAAKITDGQAYDAGHGVTIPKTIIDNTSQATIDNSVRSIQFTGTNTYRAVVSATTLESTPIPDQRTGDPVLSRKQFVPTVSLLNNIDITNLEKTSDPLLIGAIVDKNVKYFDSISAQINAKLYSATIVDNELLIRIVDDPTDTVRFDTAVNSLIFNLLNGDFIGAKLITNSNNPSTYYRIANAKICDMILGDVDGDGLVTENDLAILNTYLNYNLNVGLPLNTILNTDGYTTTTFTNGYNVYTKPFSNGFNVSFQLVNAITNVIVIASIDGVILPNPNDPRLAQFTSASVSFNSYMSLGLSSYKLVINTPSNSENFGGFDIIGLDTVTDVITLRKVFLTGDVMAQLLRADIDGDFVITTNDGYLLASYIDREVVSSSSTTTYPGPATNPYTKIGQTFKVLRFALEEFVDRMDDYSPVTIGRSTTIHPIQDIFSGDGYYDSHNFYTSPVPITFLKQLTWDESLVVCNSRARLVPSIFMSETGYVLNECTIPGVICNVYDNIPDFDPGKVEHFVPNNLIINDGGEIHRPDGNFYKVDFEVGTIVLEIPDGIFGSEKTINIMDDFIVEYNTGATPAGVTRLGFPAMRFADCSLVQANALSLDQIRFSVSVQSFSPNTNGMNTDGYNVIVDGKIGVSIDYATGLLTLNFTNLYQDPILATLNTKIQINVFLKKGGFNNQPIFIDSTKVQNMLKLISVFSGAVDGGPSALVNLKTDTVYTPATPSNWAGTPPNNAQDALDRMAALLFAHFGAIP